MNFMIVLIAAALVGIAVSSLGVMLVGRFRFDAKIRRIKTALRSESGSEELFSFEMLEGLPPAASRYLSHTIRPGTVLARRVEIEMSGQFRPGEKADWVPFEARQVLAGCTGFVWIARMRVRRFMFLSGADSYYRGEGRVRFSLMGIVPVADAAGPDVDRSAAGRLLIESCLIPTAFLPQRGARWRTSDDKRARVSLSVDGHSANITLRFNAGGSLKEAVMRRYHTGKDHEGELVPFGVAVEEEREFNGYVIPSRFRVGWWFGTEDYDEFLRAEIKSARFY